MSISPELQVALDRRAAEDGRTAVELIEEALAGHVDEVARTRAMPERRFDDLQRGRVLPISGAEVVSGLPAQNAAHHAARLG